jgi:hypothetical protein
MVDTLMDSKFANKEEETSNDCFGSTRQEAIDLCQKYLTISVFSLHGLLRADSLFEGNTWRLLFGPRIK